MEVIIILIIYRNLFYISFLLNTIFIENLSKIIYTFKVICVIKIILKF